jgi:hypothetical protein
MNEEVKSPWASKTIWGAVAVVAVAVAQVAGIELGDADKWAESIALLIGAVLAIYGRVKAVKKIGKQ